MGAAAIGGTTGIYKFTMGQCQTKTVKAQLAKAPDPTAGKGERLFGSRGFDLRPLMRTLHWDAVGAA